MEAFKNHQGLVIPFNRSNIDTDAMLPKQYLKSIRKTGYGDWLFDGLRYLDVGDVNTDTSTRKINPEFVLNLPRFLGGTILVTGDNFGCGSSREHAPWAIRDFGIKVIIAPSFADIFYNNCCKNGILPIQLASESVSKIMEEVDTCEGYELGVDLEYKLIFFPDGLSIKFDIDSALRDQLLDGSDAISLTLKYKKEIIRYEAQHRKIAPWLFNN
ncbi:MAG: 3-isopropylmalate dehydratase small subunit [Porticoccaceae bacterium]|tara:strand:+ start:2597 stop:3238 length:642 start_codon:yes stop_codon:yes gene_type:complete